MTVSGLEPRVDRWWAQTDSFSSVGGTPNNNASTFASTASSKKTESQIILEILILSLLNTIASNTTSNQRDGVFWAGIQ